MTQAEFARVMNVNRSTVNRWIARGHIEIDANGLLHSETAARMRNCAESKAPHHQARKLQIKAQKAADSGEYSSPSIKEYERFQALKTQALQDHKAAVLARSVAFRAAMDLDLADRALNGKVCPRCSERKALSDFGSDSKTIDGHTFICRACKRAENTVRQTMFGPRIKARQRQLNQQEKEQLSERYVRSLLSANSNLRRSDWPLALVEAKQIQLRILKFIKSTGTEK